MIIRPCNLNCQGCSTFSDIKWSGYTTWQEGRAEIEPWLERLQFDSWGVMGGEPLMNPDLENWIIGIRKMMPHTQIRFVTNGLLLHKNRWIVDLLHDVGNSTLKISYHIKDDLVDNEIEYIKKKFDWNPVYEYGIHRWLTDRDFRFQIARPTTFWRPFKGNYQDMLPHDNDPKDAFDICIQKRCPMLYQGKIFKCGVMALVPGILERFGNPNKEKWQPFITPGLSPDCSDEELDRFINNVGKPHQLCRQCPSSKDTQSLIDHTITVTRK